MKIQEDKIEAFVKKMMFYHDIPGLVMEIGNNKELLYKQGFGYKNIETGELIETDTVFHMASITKLFVGTAVMQLMEKGLVDIYKPITKYVPYFKIRDSRYKDITVKQMLSHTSGMPDCEDYEWENPQLDDEALERYVKDQKDRMLLWEPGGKFSYSNIAYEILGDLIAKVSGHSFEDYIHDNIFKPLNMTDTSLLTFRRDMEQIASPHIKNTEKKLAVSSVFPYNRAHAPSSTLTSNVEDIYIWGQVHLNKGVYKGVRILEESTYDLMWRPIASINDREKICLSWFMRNRHNRVIYGHEGSDIGFRSSFAVIPEEKMVISVHANIQTAPTRRIQNGILDILLGYEPKIK